MSKEINKCYHVLMVCHGNICRSPMAEYILRDLAEKAGYGDRITVASAATSTEEIGNPVHRGTREKLKQHGISVFGKTAVQMKKSDYGMYDYLIGMDGRNISNMLRILGGDPDKKVYRLLEFAGKDRDIADPWYTGNFDETYDDIKEGCEGLMRFLTANYF